MTLTNRNLVRAPALVKAYTCRIPTAISLSVLQNHIGKIFIFRDQDRLISGAVAPDGHIRGIAHPDIQDVYGRTNSLWMKRRRAVAGLRRGSSRRSEYRVIGLACGILVSMLKHQTT